MWLAAIAAVFLSVVGCTLPLPNQGKSGNDTNISLPSPSPSPSPSPTPTQQFAASAGAFHIGEVGVGYSPVAIMATGGAQPYHYTLSSGALPPGLNLATDGSVAGMPTSAGTFSFSIDVTDSGAGKAPVGGSITIASPLSASLIPACAQYCRVELGCANACGSFGQQAGGVGPFVYTQTQGQLPSGTSLNALSLTGTFTGLTGYLQFTVQVTDSLGATANLSPKFWMYSHISLTGGTIPTNPQASCPWPGAGPFDPECTASFPIGGGTPNSGAVIASASWATYTCSYQPACVSPPPMPSIVVGKNMITVSVPRGYAVGTSGYKGTLTITLTNQDVCSLGSIKCSASANVMITQASG